jgi:hypothetical protein
MTGLEGFEGKRTILLGSIVDTSFVKGSSGTVNHSREVLFMRYLILAVAMLALGLTGPLAALPASALEVGQKAPDFTVVAPGNKQIKLSDMLGKGPVVVYTFIQAFTAT